jgi:hypothetical protein
METKKYQGAVVDLIESPRGLTIQLTDRDALTEIRESWMRVWCAGKVAMYRKLAEGGARWVMKINGVEKPRSAEDIARDRAEAEASLAAWCAVKDALLALRAA